MRLTELNNEQRRQLIDVVQVFAVWRDASHKATRGSLRWVTRKGADYLYRKTGKSERSLGRRSPATEAILAEHNLLRARRKQTGARLKAMARVNRALYLNRVPKDAALVLRELDAAAVLGKHLFVIGTNALYAYEMKAGVPVRKRHSGNQRFRPALGCPRSPASGRHRHFAGRGSGHPEEGG